MMYSEFLSLGGEKVNHITFTEYSTLVEPLYIECDVDKRVFVLNLVNYLNRVEAETITGVIKRLAYEGKVDLAAGEAYMTEYVQKVALEARKLVYQMIRLEALTAIN